MFDYIHVGVQLPGEIKFIRTSKLLPSPGYMSLILSLDQDSHIYRQLCVCYFVYMETLP